MRKSKLIEYNGKIQSLADWAKETGLTYPCLIWRLRQGWSIKKTLTTPSARTTRKMRITEKQQREIFMPTPHKVDYTQCKTCQYRSTISGGSYPGSLCCGYELVKDRCRSLVSPPSPNCKVYVKGPSLVRAAAMKKSTERSMGMSIEEAIRRLVDVAKTLKPDSRTYIAFRMAVEALWAQERQEDDGR